MMFEWILDAGVSVALYVSPNTSAGSCLMQHRRHCEWH
jgi:hypothetical protein